MNIIITRRQILTSMGTALFIFFYSIFNKFSSPAYLKILEENHSLTGILGLLDKAALWDILWVTMVNIFLIIAIALVVISFSGPLGRLLQAIGSINRRYLLAAVFVFLLANTVYVLKYRNKTFPMSGDENAFLFQAKLLASGRLWVPSHPLYEFFATDYVIWEHGGKTYAEYTLGAPLFLALGVLFGAPWLVNPVLAAFSLFFLYSSAARLFDETVAGYGVVLISISSYLIDICASYNSHATSLFCLSGFLFFFLKTLDEETWFYPVLAGFLWGVGINTRQLTAFSFALPFWIWGITRLVRERKKMFMPMGLFVAGSMLPILGLMGVNTIQNGGPFIFGHSIYNSPDLVMYGFSEVYNFPYAVGSYFFRLRSILNQLIPRIFSPAVVLILLAFSFRGKVKNRLIVWVSFISVSAFYLPVYSNLWQTRYYFVPVILLIFVVVLGLRRLGVWLGSRFEGVGPDSLVFVFVLICTLYHFKTFNFKHNPNALSLMYPYQVVEEAGINNSLVFIGQVKHFYPEWYTRNSPDYDDDILYVRDLGEKNRKLMDYYPDRSYYRYDMGQLTTIE